MEGSAMFKLTSKLRKVKARLSNWHRHHQSDIKGRVAQAKEIWDEAQTMVDREPHSATAKNKERDAAKQYQQLSLDEESYYKQKSRIQWLMLGDRNTTFFHRSLQHRYSRNKICSITDDEGSTIHD
ncbi:hypothetical protein DKX38_018651 [Salix brachista]|uniref:Uncharacterized protein n=1 Tax=Salix brachista TaxID=2182728 RepID=A0A5N5KNR3_9ROSI|nr:hypothetical protein DKX38_018651 [Salix brachista]